MTIHYSIDPQIFDLFPGYCRGVVIARGIDNTGASPEILDLLRAAEAEPVEGLTIETIASHPRISAWREAYRSTGIKPSEFRPAVEALMRRVLRGDPLPSINKIVDLGNLISIKRLLPAGAHAIDVLRRDISLRRATGTEIFEPFGADQSEHPQPGEIIFVEGDTVLTRRWTWRQAKHTLVVPETTAVEINIDGLPPAAQGEVIAICRELSALVQQFCGGDTRYAVLSKENPSIVLYE